MQSMGERKMRSFSWILLRIAVASVPMFSQTTDGAKPSFEVASIKPSRPGLRESVSNGPGGRFAANNVTLKMMIGFAYRLRLDQVLGGPAWITDNQWDIEARAGDGSFANNP